MRVSERLLTLVVLCLLVIAAPAFASGKGERELKQARTLVEQRHYSKAMTLLVEIMNKYPDLREEADKLVTRIMDVRRQFNDLYAELVQAVDQKDTKRGLDLIQRLRELDPDPDPAVLTSIKIAEQKLLWAGKYSAFEAVMNAARKQLGDGSSAEAIRTYLGGFSVAKPEFDAAGYPEIQRQQALGVVAEIERVARQAADAEAAIRALPASLDALLSRDMTDAARNGFIASLAALTAAGEREAQIRTLAARVRDINTALLDAKMIATPDIWLSFIEQYVLGRPGEPLEGIAEAARRPWVEAAKRLSDTSYSVTEKAYQEADKLVTGEVDLAAFRNQAAAARSRALIALEAFAAERPAWQPAEGLELSDADRARDAELTKRAASVRQRMSEADGWEKYLAGEAGARQLLADLRRRLDAGIAAVSAGDLGAARKVFGDVAAAAGDGETQWGAIVAQATPGSTLAARAAPVRDRFASTLAEANKEDADAAVRLAAAEQGAFEPERARAEGLKQQGLDRVANRRPDQAAGIYDQALAALAGLRSAMDDWSARWKADRAWASVGPTLGGGVDGLRVRVEQLRAETEASRGQARASVDDAVDQSRQGDDSLAAARALVRAKKYADALLLYKGATTHYETSLKTLESDDVRKRYEGIPQEVASVQREATRAAFVEVSSLIAQGIDEYTGGETRRAVATLEAAKDRWDSVSQGEKNETLDYYLALARSALMEKGKETLDPTDPMYEDVRGFMTQAYLSYSGALNLVKNPPPSEEARRYIDAARASLNAIQTAIPEYREARNLKLKIDRLEKGAAGFAAELRKLVPEAIARLQDPQTSETDRKNAYLELKDYQSFEEAPQILGAVGYQKMATAVSTFEVATGIREREPTAAEIRDGTRLYNEANARYLATKGDPSWYDWILNKLAESLDKYRKKNPALALQGTVVGLRGGPQDLMSYPDITEYQQALRLDRPRARVIIQRLRAKYPDNPILQAKWNEIK